MGDILPSNVGTAEKQPPPRRRGGAPIVLVLVVLLAFMLGAGAALLWASSGRTGSPAALLTSAAPARSTLVPTPVIGRRTPTAAAPVGPLPDVNGISCDALESTLYHIHVHLAIFFDGEEQEIPFGIGVGQPWQVTDSALGPFVEDGSCFYWIHTHTSDGVIHIESPVRRRFTLGDFFAIWQVPLSSTQIGPAQGPVITYVNGKRDDTLPTDIPLTSHERIQLDVGQDVPPYQFDFAPGD